MGVCEVGNACIGLPPIERWKIGFFSDLNLRDRPSLAEELGSI